MSGRIMVQEADEQPRPPEEKPPSPPASPERPPEPAPAVPPSPPTREAGTPVVAASEASEEASDEAAPEPPGDFRKRLERVTWEKYEAKRHADELAGRLAQIEREQQLARSGGAVDPVEQAKAQIRAEDRQRQFNAACNEVFRKGQAEYQDFDDAVRALNAVGYGNRADALEAIASLPDGHRVYRALAADLDNASRVLNLPPMAMAVEMARLAIGGGAAAPAGNGVAAPAGPAVTRAPEPFKPVGGTSRSGPVPLEKTSMADFIRRRDAEERRSRILR